MHRGYPGVAQGVLEREVEIRCIDTHEQVRRGAKPAPAKLSPDAYDVEKMP
jgi:hypothetical protein